MIVGDQACVRERCEIGDDVVVGRGSLVENDTTIGALTKIQANAYITAYSTLEADVFIAPGVITTNDNFMGRTEQRHELRRGPTIRSGARVAVGGALSRSRGRRRGLRRGRRRRRPRRAPRAVVVGNPARQIREVAAEELLGARARTLPIPERVPTRARSRDLDHEVVPAFSRHVQPDPLDRAGRLRLRREQPPSADLPPIRCVPGFHRRFEFAPLGPRRRATSAARAAA